jgi:hypothetical protein
MGKLQTWLGGVLMAAAALLAPMAALGPMSCIRSVAAGACDDGSAHLVMGCASILL